MPKKAPTPKPATRTITFEITEKTAMDALAIPAEQRGKRVTPDLNEMAKFAFCNLVRQNTPME